MKKVISLFIVLLSLVSLTACKNKISTIKILEETIPSVINVNEVEASLNQIKFEVIMEKGDVTVEQVTKSMLSEEDFNKLSTPGMYTIIINYQDFKASLTLNIDDPNAYSVKVIYPNGEPVTSGVTVQWCTGDICLLPVAVNNIGVAYNELEDSKNYYIHIDGIPSGYTYDPNAYTTNKDNKKVEIKLIALNELSGEGTLDNPYVVSENAVTVTYDAQGVLGVKFYSFTPSESGTYSIKSLAVDKLALNAIDPYIGFLGSVETDIAKSDVSGNVDSKVNINFNHTFTAEAGVTYRFIVFVTSATKYPATFDIVISK